MSSHLERQPASSTTDSPKARFVPFSIWGGWAIAVVVAIISVLGQKEVVVTTGDNKRLEAELAARDQTISEVRRQMQDQAAALNQTREQLSALAGKLPISGNHKQVEANLAGSGTSSPTTGMTFGIPTELDGIVPPDGNYQGTVGVCRGGVEPRDVHGSGQLCIQSTTGAALKLNMSAMTRTRYAENIRRERSIPGDPSIGFYELNVGDAVLVHVENGLASIITILRQRSM
jgi:uncharacterized coiled-coil protein SlyX